MGEWEGRTFAALHGEAPRLVAQLFNDPARFVYPHGESFGVFTARVRGALDNLLKTHKSSNIALITHGGVCRVIVGDALGMLAQNWLRLCPRLRLRERGPSKLLFLLGFHGQIRSKKDERALFRVTPLQALVLRVFDSTTSIDPSTPQIAP